MHTSWPREQVYQSLTLCRRKAMDPAGQPGAQAGPSTAGAGVLGPDTRWDRLRDAFGYAFSRVEPGEPVRRSGRAGRSRPARSDTRL